MATNLLYRSYQLVVSQLPTCCIIATTNLLYHSYQLVVSYVLTCCIIATKLLYHMYQREVSNYKYLFAASYLETCCLIATRTNLSHHPCSSFLLQNFRHMYLFIKTVRSPNLITRSNVIGQSSYVLPQKCRFFPCICNLHIHIIYSTYYLIDSIGGQSPYKLLQPYWYCPMSTQLIHIHIRNVHILAVSI